VCAFVAAAVACCYSIILCLFDSRFCVCWIAGSCKLLNIAAAALVLLQEGNEFPDAKKVTVRGSPDNVASAKAQIKQVRHLYCGLAG
jgi:hypothetical protein